MKMNSKKIYDSIVEIINDIDKVPKQKYCFPYPRTIKSILIGAKTSPFLDFFKNKPYFEIVKTGLTNKELHNILEKMCCLGILRACFNEKNGKTYYEVNHMIDVHIEDDFQDIDDALDDDSFL